VHTYETSVATPGDLFAADRIREYFTVRSDMQQAMDFQLVSQEEAVSRHTHTMSEPVLMANASNATSSELFDELIGLEDIKAKVKRYVKQLGVKARKEERMPSPHLLLMGNPGTGKTTMARAVAQALYEEGIIDNPSNFVEVSRRDLVGFCVGHTAPKTMMAINKARHGMLFIDEAYALGSGGEHDYGAEAIATLVQEMENCLNDFERNGFVCVMAGYTKPMEAMLSINPGLRDRFAHRIDFRDYQLDELTQIFYKMLNDRKLLITPKARPLAENLLARIYDARDENFSNARIVRKLVEHLEMIQIDLYGDDPTIKVNTVEQLEKDSEVQLLMAGGASKEEPHGLAFS
jgi:stage V sporulation protein K